MRWGLGHGVNHLRSASGRHWGGVNNNTRGNWSLLPSRRSVPIEGEEVHPYRVSLHFARLSRGNAPCRWYINPEVTEAKALLSSLGDMNRPIKWDNQIAPNTSAASVEEKRISETIKLNPFKNKE
ncbi:unnamed protein product [Urochloa humidicola]